MNSENSFQLGTFGSFIQIPRAALCKVCPCWKEGTRVSYLRVHQRMVRDGGCSGAVPSRCAAPKPVLSSPFALKVTPFHPVRTAAPAPSWGQKDGLEHGGRERRVREAPAYPA